MRSKAIVPIVLFFYAFSLPSCSNQNGREKTEMESPMVVGSDTDKDHNMPMGDDLKATMSSSMEKMASMEMTGDFDIDFAKMMIIHHQSAIDMSEIEVAKGKHDDMKAMAQKMIAAQNAKIQQFQSIINNHKPTSEPHNSTQHGGGEHNEL